MADTYSPRTASYRSSPADASQWLFRSVFSLAIATFFLMGLGSATRVMNAGLACPDWPLCYGSVLPAAEMNVQVFLEWFHRLVATFVGGVTLVLAGLAVWYRHILPPWLPRAMGGAIALVLTQGILGGLTVTELLRFEVVTAHLGTGLLFFSLLLGITAALMPFTPTGTAAPLVGAGAAAATLIYGQSILGALVASRWALHQCFANADLCTVMNSHLLGIVPATLGAVVLVAMAWRTAALQPVLRRLSYLLFGLLLLQLALGYATYRLHLQVAPLTVAHQSIGAALLGTTVCFTVLAWRDRLGGMRHD